MDVATLIVKPAVSAAPIMSFGAERAGEEFTPDQLVQLSISGGGEDACSSSSALSSPRSVNNNAARHALLAAAMAPEDDDEDGDGDDNAGLVDQRARKRYRLVTEVYAATRRAKLKSDDADGGKRKKKSRDGINRMER